MDIPKHDPAALKALFDAEPLATLSFGLDYTYGFILAMISAPDMIQPSEWLPMLFKSRELPEFGSKKQTEASLGALISIWSFWAAETEDSETLTLPPEYGLEADGNPTPGLQAFCRGYLEGSEWLRELWDEALEGYEPESKEDKIAGTALFLCFYFCKERELPEDSAAARELSAMPVGEVWEQLPAALTDAAALGRALHVESLRASEPLKAPPKPGRNDPCPCGSGKKYKKCCLSKPPTSSSTPGNR